MNFVFFVYCNIVATHTYDGHTEKRKEDQMIYKDIKNAISKTGILNKRIFDKFTSCKSCL